MESIWIAELDRFGYDLRAVGKTEAEAKNAIVREYKRAYEEINHCKYSKDEYNSMVEDIELTELEFGKVEWR